MNSTKVTQALRDEEGPPETILEIGRFQYRPRTREICSGQRRWNLTEGPARVLDFLRANCNRPVTYEEFMAAAKTHTSDDAIRQHVKSIRRAFPKTDLIVVKQRKLSLRHGCEEFREASRTPSDALLQTVERSLRAYIDMQFQKLAFDVMQSLLKEIWTSLDRELPSVITAVLVSAWQQSGRSNLPPNLRGSAIEHLASGLDQREIARKLGLTEEQVAESMRSMVEQVVRPSE